MSDDLQDKYVEVFESSVEFGRREAVLVIDFINAYIDPSSALYAPDVVTATQESAMLLKLTRGLAVPVI